MTAPSTSDTIITERGIDVNSAAPDDHFQSHVFGSYLTRWIGPQPDLTDLALVAAVRLRPRSADYEHGAVGRQQDVGA